MTQYKTNIIYNKNTIIKIDNLYTQNELIFEHELNNQILYNESAIQPNEEQKQILNIFDSIKKYK